MFTKGDPRINRKGRPKKEMVITEGIRAYLRKKGKRKQYIEHMFEMFFKQNSVGAMQEINNRVEGKVKEQVQVTHHLLAHIPRQQEDVDRLERAFTPGVTYIPPEEKEQQAPVKLCDQPDFVVDCTS